MHQGSKCSTAEFYLSLLGIERPLLWSWFSLLEKLCHFPTILRPCERPTEQKPTGVQVFTLPCHPREDKQMECVREKDGGVNRGSWERPRPHKLSEGMLLMKTVLLAQACLILTVLLPSFCATKTKHPLRTHTHTH